jgi:hypothetical protein
MNIKSLLATVALVGAFIGAVQAADSGLTVNSRVAVKPVGESPEIGYVEATVVSPTNGVTMDLPAPRGRSNIRGTHINVYSSLGALKPAIVSVTNGVLTVSGSVATSGTLAAGDVIKGIVVYKP